MSDNQSIEQCAAHCTAILALCLVLGCFRTPMDEGGPAGSRPDVGPAVAADAAAMTVLDAKAETPDGTPTDIVPAVADRCTIAGVEYLVEQGDPANACRSCQPAISTTEWTTVATGPGCLAAGDAHTCAVINGSAWCWGANSSGQLGSGSFEQARTPQQVRNLGPRVSAMAAGFGHSCAVVAGEVFCWGMDMGKSSSGSGTTDSNLPVKIARLPIGVSLIVAGVHRDCALTGDGVWCWEAISDALSIGPVVGLPSGVHSLAVGTSHACAATNAEVWCWGDNTFGQLGRALTDGAVNSEEPAPVPGVSGSIYSLTACASQSCVLTHDGVRCWGKYGAKIPPQAAEPVFPLDFPSSTSLIVGRRLHICGIVGTDSDVMCLGDAYYGELGDGTATETALAPVNVAGGLSQVRALAAGDNHTCAAAATGIWCWGRNSDGQLGDDTNKDSAVPVRVHFP